MKRLLLLSVLLLFCASTMLAAQSFTLTWTKSVSTGVIRTVVLRSLTDASGYAPIDSLGVLPGDTLYTDNGATTLGTRYYYRLQSVANNGLRSVLSSSVSGQYLRPTDTQTLRILSVTRVSAGTYQVTWTSTGAMTGFIRYRAENTPPWVMTLYDKTAGTTHMVTLMGLPEPARYEFQAIGYPGNTSSMTVSVAYAADLTGPPAPPSMHGVYPF